MTKAKTKKLTVLRRPEVELLVGLKKSSIYYLMEGGYFPRPIKLGARAVGWRLCDLSDWIETRPKGGFRQEPGVNDND